ncbi:Ankyrin repeat [Macleaya cordata]|uniref:Ankyrin repeat n=1 Tax=Macleaya cordata TaxID=56857 RepID=A0A200RAR2_MACCD|nr:Ankyrin repeat [Macleaya cordata]
MISLKPEFAGELNQNGFGPIHLASANGYLEIVKELLMVNRDHCRLKSRDKRTPLHYAAIKGRIEVINELVFCCEDSVEDVTIRGETALHLAVKNNQFEAFRFIVERVRQLNKEDILNKKDQEGNTVVELLLGKDASSTTAVVNAMNKTRRAQELAQSLDQVLENSINEATSEVTITESPLDRLVEFFKFQRGRESPSDARTALLVIAVLIATATYQAGLSPPGGVWQDDGKPPTESSNSNHNASTSSRYSAGLAILSTKDAISFRLFLLFNSAGFYTSLFMIRILTCGFPLRLELEICIWAMGFTYSTAILTITPKSLSGILFNVVIVAVFPIAIPLFAKWWRVLMEKKPWKCLGNRIHFRRRNLS